MHQFWRMLIFSSFYTSQTQTKTGGLAMIRPLALSIITHLLTGPVTGSLSNRAVHSSFVQYFILCVSWFKGKHKNYQRFKKYQCQIINEVMFKMVGSECRLL